MESINRYKTTAHLYDLDDRGIVKDDIPFYLERAGEIQGEILELACGTGRVTIPLAKAGHRVTGLDLSRDMLQVLEHKISDESEIIQENIRLYEGDMTDFDLNRQYPLVIIPFRAFQLLTKEEQQIGCLDKVKSHLKEDGVFIINAYKPVTRLDEAWVQPEKEDWTIIDPATGNKVKRTHIRKRIDVTNQVNYPDLIYYVTSKDGTEEKYIEELAMKYYYEEQLRALLISRGFSIVEELGYYDGRPIAEGPELIFICRKTK